VIAKGELRMGRTVEDERFDKPIVQWYHPTCMFDFLCHARAFTRKLKRVEDLKGFPKLPDKEKELIRKLLADAIPKYKTYDKPAPAAAASDDDDDDDDDDGKAAPKKTAAKKTAAKKTAPKKASTKKSSTATAKKTTKATAKKTTKAAAKKTTKATAKKTTEAAPKQAPAAKRRRVA